MQGLRQAAGSDVSRRAGLAAMAGVVGALALLLALTSSAPTAGSVAGARLGAAQARHATQITSFRQGQFPEGVAVSRSGRPFVSVTTFGATEKKPGTARVVKVSRSGAKTPVGPQFNVGFGLLTGLAFNAKGRLYIADASYRAPGRPGVWGLNRDGSASEILKLTDKSFPNGLAFRGDDLYVSDSSLGLIRRVKPGGRASVWAKSHLLAPKKAFGANGIAFWHRNLYVAVTDAGRIVRIPVRPSGAAGEPVVVAKQKALRGADGIAFDRRGNLYVTTSSTNLLLRLAPDGDLARVARRSDGLLYPTTPAFGAPTRPKRLLVVNGDLLGRGTPNLVAFHTRHGGRALP